MFLTAVFLTLVCFGYTYGRCPEFYVPVGEFCFFVSEIKGSWAEANSYCRTFNAALAEPKTDASQAAMTTALKNLSGPWDREYFVGGSDFFHEAHWIWSTESIPITASHWYPGNPSNSAVGEDCMAVMKTGKWNDIACDTKLQFICERGALESPDVIG